MIFPQRTAFRSPGEFTGEGTNLKRKKNGNQTRNHCSPRRNAEAGKGLQMLFHICTRSIEGRCQLTAGGRNKKTGHRCVWRSLRK